MVSDEGTVAAKRILLRLYAFLLADDLVPPLCGVRPARLSDFPSRYDYLRRPFFLPPSLLLKKNIAHTLASLCCAPFSCTTLQRGKVHFESGR